MAASVWNTSTVTFSTRDGSTARCWRAWRTERHRDLTSELPWEPDADHLLDAVHQLRHLGLPVDHHRKEPAFALVGHVLPGDELDVLNGAGKVLQLILRERREERNRGQLIDGEHDAERLCGAGRIVRSCRHRPRLADVQLV
jgi:hypothetical protein